MKVKSNISFKKLVNILQIDADIKFCSLDNYGVKFIKGMPTDLKEIEFSNFASAVRYADGINNSIEFIYRLTGTSKRKLMRSKATRIYPIYVNYLKQVKQIMDMFEKINAELPPSKNRVIKTMSEFGMSNIIDYVSNERSELHDYYYKQSVAWITVEYMRKAHKQINIAANNGTNTK